MVNNLAIQHGEQQNYSHPQTDEMKEADCYQIFSAKKVSHGGIIAIQEKVATETPIALVYNGISHVVMMATPSNLEEFALGFSLSEGIIDCIEQVYDIDITQQEHGIEINITISTEKFVKLKLWRRNQTGRTGCGLCGAESLQQAIRPIPTVPATMPISFDILQQAILSLSEQQLLLQQTGASHCAAWCNQYGKTIMLNEDIGRHNALDKLIGNLTKEKIIFSQGFALISSRASYEMVTKSCQVGISVLVAVSAPTSLAIQLAKKSGLTLIGFARTGRFTIYTQNYSEIVDEH
jgi:FdhD protein